VRRSVSFAQAIYDGQITIEGVTGRFFRSYQSIDWNSTIPVLVDPEMSTIDLFHPDVVVDARMIKQEILSPYYPTIFTVGLGPGFIAGINSNAVIETQRGHFMGRAIYDGSAETDTGVPERVANFQQERVLRSPVDGVFHTTAKIGQLVDENEEIARVAKEVIKAPFSGMIRGLLHDSLNVKKGIKVGDIDPRKDSRLFRQVSDKALAVGGGVVEAIFSQPAIRAKMCD
jgi:xanthine dehydrogenase accessory factor